MHHIFNLLLLFMFYTFLIYFKYQQNFPYLLSSHYLTPPHIYAWVTLTPCPFWKGRLPMWVNKLWHLKFRKDKDPLPAPRLGKAIQHGEHIPKSQLKCQGQVLIPLLGVPQTKLQKGHTYGIGPRSVPWGLLSCGSSVLELPHQCICNQYKLFFLNDWNKLRK